MDLLTKKEQQFLVESTRNGFVINKMKQKTFTTEYKFYEAVNKLMKLQLIRKLRTSQYILTDLGLVMASNMSNNGKKIYYTITVFY